MNEGSTEQKRVIIRNYPSVVYFYPSMLAGYIIWLLFSIFEPTEPNILNITATAFLIIFAFNFVVVSFDFGHAKTLAIFFAILLAFILYLYLEAIEVIDFSIKFYFDANADRNFYFWLSSIMLGCFVIAWIGSRIEYWEVRSREIIHNYGPLSDAKRYPAEDCVVFKEIKDIFEHILLRSGTIVLIPKGRETAIVMENVPNVNKKEKQITDILGVVPIEPQNK